MALLFSCGFPVFGQGVSVTSVYHPPVLTGISVHSENPLLFDFIVDRGQENLNDQSLKYESRKLIKYFLASMTIPDPDAWVNLSPHEHDRIMPEALSQTDMGKVMLEQDYLLKQLASSLTNPDKELGQKYWQEVKDNTPNHQELGQQSLTSFNKVWIVPAGATVVEKDGFAYILNSQLKVMMDEDYVGSQLTQKKATKTAGENISTQVFRRIILPQLEKEVNSGKSFAATRQVYQSVILAAWFKRTLKESLLGKVYVDQSKIIGININEKDVKQKIYDQYLETFKKGVYSVIKEESNPEGEMIPRKYFSGGLKFGMMDLNPADGLTIIKASSALKVAVNELSSRSKVIVKATVEEPHAQILNNDLRASSGLLSNPQIIMRIVARLKFLFDEKKLQGTLMNIQDRLPIFFTSPGELAMVEKFLGPRLLLAWFDLKQGRKDLSTLPVYMSQQLGLLNESNLFKSQIETWFRYAELFYPGPDVRLSKERSVPYVMRINNVVIRAIGEFENDPFANQLLSLLMMPDETIRLAKNGQLAIVLDQSFTKNLGQRILGDPKGIAVLLADLLGIPMLFLPISAQPGQSITPVQTLENIQSGLAQHPNITTVFLIADDAAIGPAARLLNKSASSATISAPTPFFNTTLTGLKGEVNNGETAPHPFQMRPDRQPLREPEQESEQQKPVGKMGFGESPDSSLARPVGGIDFNPSKVELQIKRDDNGVPLPIKDQNLEKINIEGLYPVIINILPVNPQTLPILGQLQ